MKTHAGTGRIQLQVEGRGFDRLLFITSQLGKAVSEGIGDTEVHERL
jgi:hypothetical protein